jgi:hypothetical protein
MHTIKLLHHKAACLLPLKKDDHPRATGRLSICRDASSDARCHLVLDIVGVFRRARFNGPAPVPRDLIGKQRQAAD